jgi:hypothetical protein
MEHAWSIAIHSVIHQSMATDWTSATGGLPRTDDAMSASGLLRTGMAGPHIIGLIYSKARIAECICRSCGMIG